MQLRKVEAHITNAAADFDRQPYTSDSRPYIL